MKTTKVISVKCHGNNTDLHPLIINLLNAGTKIAKKDYALRKYLIFLKR